MREETLTSMGIFSDLRGKIAIITGAARGIGEAIAESVALAGAKVLAVDIKDSVTEDNASRPRNWHGFQSDVSNPSQVNELVEHCLSKLGPPEILVNIAAVSTPCPVKDMPLKNWRMNIDINLTSVFLCTQAVLPHMVGRGKGSIVSFSSVIASTGGETSAHYCAAKAGIEGFSRSLAKEVGPSGIRVNVISPGLIETPMLALMPENQKKKLISRLPLQRVGYPRDLIGLALLLVSDAGSYITGQTIQINGGLDMN